VKSLSVAFARNQSITNNKLGVDHVEAYVSTQQSKAKKQAWFSRANGHIGRTPRDKAPPPQGAQAFERFTLSLAVLPIAQF
jgi:hypothetical protein